VPKVPTGIVGAGLGLIPQFQARFLGGEGARASVTVKKIYIIIRGNITTFTKCFSSVSLVNAYWF